MKEFLNPRSKNLLPEPGWDYNTCREASQHLTLTPPYEANIEYANETMGEQARIWENLKETLRNPKLHSPNHKRIMMEGGIMLHARHGVKEGWLDEFDWDVFRLHLRCDRVNNDIPTPTDFWVPVTIPDKYHVVELNNKLMQSKSWRSGLRSQYGIVPQYLVIEKDGTPLYYQYQTLQNDPEWFYSAHESREADQEYVDGWARRQFSINDCGELTINHLGDSEPDKNILRRLDGQANIEGDFRWFYEGKYIHTPNELEPYIGIYDYEDNEIIHFQDLRDVYAITDPTERDKAITWNTVTFLEWMDSWNWGYERFINDWDNNVKYYVSDCRTESPQQITDEILSMLPNIE